MALQIATLTEKIQLTHDVYELVYESDTPIEMQPGQFITFLLPEIGGRAYSILALDDKTHIRLIIKRWSREMGGRGGSIALCDAEIGETYKFVGPTGTFTLSDRNVTRCFLGTGTGFVPLYNQIIAALERGDSAKIHFIFGVRHFEDYFYLEELDELLETYRNFSYTLTLSQEDNDRAFNGYVTDRLTPEWIAQFQEYYICGAPIMVESAKKLLADAGVSSDDIKFEEYD